MIQRIQTFYMFLVVAACGSMFFLPIYSGTGIGTTTPQIQTIVINQEEVKVNFVLNVDETANIKKLMVVLNTLDIVIAVLIFIAIFLYRTRDMQLRMTRYLILFSFVYIALLIYSTYEARAMISNVKDHFGAGLFVPLLSPVLLFLATRGIDKDISLVKSADRLR